MRLFSVLLFRGKISKGKRWGFTPDPTRGLIPLDPHLAILRRWNEPTSSACRVGVMKCLRASGPRKPGKSHGEKLAFPWGLFPGFPRMQSIRAGGSFRRLNRRKSAQRTLLVSPDLTADEIPATGGHRRFVRRARSITVPCLTSAFLQATAGIKIVFSIKQYPLLWVQGGHRPGAGFRGRIGPCFVFVHNKTLGFFILFPGRKKETHVVLL